MFLRKLANNFFYLAFCWFFALSLMVIQKSFASYDAPRDRMNYVVGSIGGKIHKNQVEQCRPSSAKEPIAKNDHAIDFDPMLTGNVDANWKFDNPTCAAFIGTLGANLVASSLTAKFACCANNPIGAVQCAPEQAADSVPPPQPILSPNTLVRLFRRFAVCGKRQAEYVTLQSIAAASCASSSASCPQDMTNAGTAATDATKCCAASALETAAKASYVAALTGVYESSKNAYINNKVCGHGWFGWRQNEEETWLKTKGIYRECIENNFLNGQNKRCRDKDDNLENNSRTIRNAFYREFIFGGIEHEDKGSSACKVPSSWGSEKRLRILGYESSNQRYYMTGAGNAPAFACHRFLLSDRNDEEAKAAYECCKQRSKNTMCIQGKHATRIDHWEHEFCKIGSRCNVAGTVYEIYESKKESNYACAKTYNWCPYDHLLGGGTEHKEVNSQDQSQYNNFCQFMNHCQKLPVQPHFRVSSLDGGYISQACRDLKGDSQNVYGYTAELIPINARGFSAPFVQCFKESLENIFLHKAGHTKCEDPDEYPNAQGVCDSGYIFQEGEKLPGDSFFVTIKNKLQSVIRVILVLAIVVFGVGVLFAVPGVAIERKKLVPFVLKIALVIYFATGDGWNDKFVSGVFGTSSFLADLMFKNDESAPPEKLDGCQFPKFNYLDSNESTRYEDAQYPENKEYLRVWDIMDCKIARALGFGPNVSVPNLFLMIMGGFFTGGAGIIFFVAAFFFAFMLIAVTIRAIHIMLIATAGVVILVYVSPITIAMSLFPKTKGIFEGWWKNLLGFTLQPMILFAYLGIYITLFDALMIGDVTFSGNGYDAPKEIQCLGETKNTSIYCIFKVANIKTYSGLEVIGIGIPILESMNQIKINAIIKAALIMFIFATFMDKISTFASELVGGSKIESNWKVGATDLAEKSFKTLRAIQKRGQRGGFKGAKKAYRTGNDIANWAGNKFGNKGKSVSATQSQESGAIARTGAGSKSGASRTESSVHGALAVKSSADSSPVRTGAAKVPGGASKIQSENVPNGASRVGSNNVPNGASRVGSREVPNASSKTGSREVPNASSKTGSREVPNGASRINSGNVQNGSSGTNTPNSQPTTTNNSE